MSNSSSNQENGLPTSKKLTRYTPYLNGTAFMGMLKQNETHPEMFGPDHDLTHGPYVLAADADAEVERLTAKLREEQELVEVNLLRMYDRALAYMRERDRLRAALHGVHQQLAPLEQPRSWDDSEVSMRVVQALDFVDRALSAEPSSDDTTNNLCGNEVRIRCVQPKGHDGLHESQAGLQWAPGYAEKASVDGQQVAVAQESLKCSKCGNTWMSIPRMGIISACGLDPSKTMAQCEHGPLAQNGEAD